jgi:hypothetical protein
MIGKSGLVVLGADGLEVVEQQERIEMVEPPRADAAAEVHPGPLHHRLGLDDLGDRA